MLHLTQIGCNRERLCLVAGDEAGGASSSNAASIEWSIKADITGIGAPRPTKRIANACRGHRAEGLLSQFAYRPPQSLFSP